MGRERRSVHQRGPRGGDDASPQARRTAPDRDRHRSGLPDPMRLWGRPRSIRLRLAGLLTALFVLLGGTLLGVSYALVRSNLTVDPRQLAETAAERLGLEPRRGPGGESVHGGHGEAL